MLADRYAQCYLGFVLSYDMLVKVFFKSSRIKIFLFVRKILDLLLLQYTHAKIHAIVTDSAALAYYQFLYVFFALTAEVTAMIGCLFWQFLKHLPGNLGCAGLYVN